MSEPSKTALADIVRYHFVEIENYAAAQYPGDSELGLGIADLRQALNDYFGAISLSKLGPKGSQTSAAPVVQTTPDQS
ncbi:hypothetical protein SAMN03159496_05485 [Rhizobium sp. NFR07]|uniref:hypothetical protein n=1 Tax=Rhizobium sp. NFR07 TaxID=1566262 RepID=UPI0008E252C3|nr:hypothetical protein [Rhizobium sp. NFR07]SFB59176.1 hypothetical protein SAMN03159496_05485 [Rhizobium sp. NFR07]